MRIFEKKILKLFVVEIFSWENAAYFFRRGENDKIAILASHNASKGVFML